MLLFDSDDPDAIPSGVAAAGYVDGYAGPAWLSRGFARFPGARRIAVWLATTARDGDSFDVETGDMTPAQAPQAVRNAHARGIGKPWVYVNRANGHLVESALETDGITIDQVLLWVATDDGTQVVTHWDDGSPVKYRIVAVQYANSALSGGHYDLSIVNELFGPAAGGVDELDSTQSGQLAGLDEQINVRPAGSIGAKIVDGYDKIIALYNALPALSAMETSVGDLKTALANLKVTGSGLTPDQDAHLQALELAVAQIEAQLTAGLKVDVTGSGTAKA